MYSVQQFPATLKMELNPPMSVRSSVTLWRGQYYDVTSMKCFLCSYGTFTLLMKDIVLNVHYVRKVKQHPTGELVCEYVRYLHQGILLECIDL